MRSNVLAALSLSFALTGCAFGPSASPSPEAGVPIAGLVHGGQQPISGAHIYLFAANTTGYGGSGLAASTSNASTSLLVSGDGTDSLGTYVLSGSSGAFNITSSEYACAPGQQVYAYSLGGNPGAGANSSAGLLAILGGCPAAGNFIGSDPFLAINEVTTVAAAYAFAGFATDATHVSSSGTALAQTGIANAFANAANLVTLATGSALTSTPGGVATVPQATIDTIADILAACVNSDGSTTIVDSGVTSTVTTAPCGTLFSNATLDGTSTGTQPTDTASAAIDIAHHPGSNVAALFGLQPGDPAFAANLSSQPKDFTIGLNFTASSINQPKDVAIDASGNAWVASQNCSCAVEISAAGALLSGTGGFTGGYISLPNSIAVDQAGYVWIGDPAANAVTKISSAGAIQSGATGYANGVVSQPEGLALDGSGNAWIASHNSHSVVELTASGTVLSGAGFAGGQFVEDFGIAVDGSNNVWVTGSVSANGPLDTVKLSSAGAVLATVDDGPEFVSGASVIAIDSAGDAWFAGQGNVIELSNAGAVLSGSSGYTIPGIGATNTVAIDGAGNVWVTNAGGTQVGEISSAGTTLSGTQGYAGGGMSSPSGIAVDGSGNLWTANGGNNSVTELIGVATPVVTPIAAGLPTTPTSDGSSNLGTRP
jgi:streptogramin lyase